MTAPMVYQAIAKVTAELAREGISKNRKNIQQGYAFRGIDDVYNALSPALASNYLCVLPRVLGRDMVERQNKNGTALFYVTVDVEFDFVSAEDGSKHTVRTFGEAMDSGDKATNKAMSAAYKYAAMQTFCIPTEGDNDADATTHEVKPVASVKNKGDEPLNLEIYDKPKSSAALKRAGSWDELKNELAQDMADVRSLVGLGKLKVQYREKAKSQGWPKKWPEALADEFAWYKDHLPVDAVSEIQKQHPGATVVAEHIREQSFLEAGE